MNASKKRFGTSLFLIFLLVCAFALAPAVRSGQAAGKESNNPDNPQICTGHSPPIVVGTLKDRRLVEISDMAVSRKNPGVLWVHNDSGDGPFVYAIDKQGRSLGKLVLSGVKARDWEDMAIGPCGDTDCLYLGDIGDNKNRRDDCAVYRVKEPVVSATTPFKKMTVHAVERIAFSYPAGPQNAEALGVHPNGTVYLMTKEGAGKATLYAFETLKTKGSNRLRQVGAINTTQGKRSKITAMDISQDGRSLLLRTYSEAWLYRICDGAPFEKILESTRRLMPVAPERQGEAIALDSALCGYYQVSEGLYPTLYFVNCVLVQPGTERGS